jgi:hypothetical protein
MEAVALGEQRQTRIFDPAAGIRSAFAEASFITGTFLDVTGGK